MFENLNNSEGNANNKNLGNDLAASNERLPQQPEVDDIFADTDKPADLNQSNQHLNGKSEIVTKHVGLGANSNVSELDDEDDEKKGGKTFTIVVIAMVVVIIGLLGFLVYSKFFQKDVEPELVVNNEAVVVDEDINADEETANQEELNEDNDEFNDYIPLTPGEDEESADIEDESTDLKGEDDETNVSGETVIDIDSDGDGLTDREEALYGTNPLLVDTDGDGLSDYEEIKIYGTDPLNPDTDGDGYTDGEEVNNGYNPLGEGMLGQ